MIVRRPSGIDDRAAAVARTAAPRHSSSTIDRPSTHPERFLVARPRVYTSAARAPGVHLGCAGPRYTEGGRACAAEHPPPLFLFFLFLLEMKFRNGAWCGHLG